MYPDVIFALFLIFQALEKTGTEETWEGKVQWPVGANEVNRYKSE